MTSVPTSVLTPNGGMTKGISSSPAPNKISLVYALIRIHMMFIIPQRECREQCIPNHISTATTRARQKDTSSKDEVFFFWVATLS